MQWVRSCWKHYEGYFSTKATQTQQSLVYLVLVLAVTAYSLVSVASLWLGPHLPCDLPGDDVSRLNPDYNHNINHACAHKRHGALLWMHLHDCDVVRRLLSSLVLGSMIGYERRSPDRPAGIRTMAIASLGSCMFTLTSIFAFISGPMTWDSSRVSAAIPSGVGFLGAGLIWKGWVGEEGDQTHQVHGLTTAASLWFSAAIGVACGGAMYAEAMYAVCLLLVVLRFGPRNPIQPVQENEDGGVISDEEKDIFEAAEEPQLDVAAESLTRLLIDPRGSRSINTPVARSPSSSRSRRQSVDRTVSFRRRSANNTATIATHV